MGESVNRERRKAIEELVSQLETIKDAIETLQQEEQDYYDNMPEAIQAGDKGNAASEAANALEMAADQVGDVIDQLNEAKGE